MTMVTESGEVPVPAGARWAALTTVGPAQFEGRGGKTNRTVLNVSEKASIRVDVSEARPGEAGSASAEEAMVLIEWLFDSDDTGSH